MLNYQLCNANLQGGLERAADSKDIVAPQVYLNACMIFQTERLTYNTKQKNKSWAEITKDTKS